MKGMKHELHGNVEFIGLGGPLMAEQGLETLFSINELSVMGIAEILPRIVKLLKRIRETSDAVIESKPLALITIDSPDFCLRVAKNVKKHLPDLPTIHYVAPSVWAWRPGRADKMAKHIDHVLALLPFEPPYMQAAGMTCDFVGHPVVAERQASAIEVDEFCEFHRITVEQKLLTVLPGSRRSEIKLLAPVFREVINLLRKDLPYLSVIIPSVAHMVPEIEKHFAGMNVTILDPRDLSADESEMRKRVCMAASDAALAASGTVSLELAAAGTPMIIAHKLNFITATILRRVLRISTVTLVNLVTEKMVVPEYLQENCTAKAIYPAIRDLLCDDDVSIAQLQAGEEAMHLLGKDGEAPGILAARSVLSKVKL